MKILVDCCNYFLDNNNNGDKAIYKVLVSRLAHFWPNAEINWITLDPALIQQTIPTVSPFTLQQRHHWQLFNSSQQQANPPRPGIFSIFQSQPHLNSNQRTLMRKIPDSKRFVKKFREADLIIALGGGSFSDHFASHSTGLLDTLQGGVIFDKPAALLCAGFEEISNQTLLEKCKNVLPQLSLISCREVNIGPDMLSSFNVSKDKVHVTGDDAIELAYSLRSDEPGEALGINLRQSEYSEINESSVGRVKGTLHQAGYNHKAALFGVPISLFGPSDIESIEKIINGYSGLADSGRDLVTPELVIRQIGRCRVVITGSYHSAVFSLAQGIPVIAIARSHHYKSKLEGLKTQFKVGCTILDPNDQGFEKSLKDAIDAAWGEAPSIREYLLEMARLQVEESWKVSHKLFDLVKNSTNVLK